MNKRGTERDLSPERNGQHGSEARKERAAPLTGTAVAP
jgi:hypothetical protein